MFTKSLTLTAIILVFSACHLQAAIINSRWVGGTEGEWGNPNNWNPPIVPDNGLGQTFFVTIDGRSFGREEVEVTLRENRTIDKLDVYGKVQLQRRVRENLKDIVLAIEEDLDLTLTVTTPYNGLINHGFLDFEDLIICANVVNEDGACLGTDVDIYDGSLRNATNARLEGDDNLDPKQASFIRLQCNQAGDFIWTQPSCSSRSAG